MNKEQLSRAEKNLVGAFALQQERGKYPEVLKVRLLTCGDVKAYCDDGHTYWVAPTAVLLKHAKEHAHDLGR